jgi:glycosyltransferase involved in cell wall biosynthesis
MKNRFLLVADINLATFEGSTAHFLGVLSGFKKLNILPLILLPKPYPPSQIFPKENLGKVYFYPSLGDYSSFISKFRYLLSLIYFFVILIKKKPNIIYCRFTPLFLGHLLIAKIFKKKIILEVNNTPTDFSYRRNFKNFLNSLISLSYLLSGKIADKLIVVANGMRRDLINLGIDKRKIALIPNGTNPEIFKPQKSLIKKDFYVGFLSKIDNYHDFEKIITLGEALKEEKNIKFLIIGKIENHKLREEIKRRNLEEKFIFTSEIPYWEVPFYINLFDIALITTPEKFCGYTSPIKLFDYAGCGKIILVNKELVEKERSLKGIPMVTYSSIADLKNKILTIKKEFNYYLENYGKKARQMVLKRYNWETIVKKSLKGITESEASKKRKIEKKVILQVIGNLSGGGAQTLLLNFLKEKETKKFNFEIFTFKKKYSLLTFISLLKKIKKVKPDIIHAHLFPELYYVALASFFYKKAKYLYTEHNVFNRRQKYKFLYPLERFIYQRYDKIIACAHIVKEQLIKYLPKIKEKIVVIPNGFSLSGKEIKENEEKADLCFIGRLEEQKGVDILFRALRILKEKGISPKTFIVGSGSWEERLKLLKEKEQLSNIVFLGKRTDALSFLKASKIFVLPSRWEGLPITILEAASLKKPIIVTDVGGVKEVLTEEEAIIIKKEEPKLLANAIEKLLFNEKLQEELGEKAYAKVSNHFSIKTFSKKMVSLYEGLLKR